MENKMNLNWLFNTGIGKAIIMLFVGLSFIFGKESFLSSKNAGIIFIIISILFIIQEIITHIKVRKSKKSEQIENNGQKQIAFYFEKNDIKYIYKPKEEKLFDFFLPQYDVYIKYWEERYSKFERDELIKYAKKQEIKFIEIFYDKLISMNLLHSSFMKKLSEQLKKK